VAVVVVVVLVDACREMGHSFVEVAVEQSLVEVAAELSFVEV
jgi:hypothetical protein